MLNAFSGNVWFLVNEIIACNQILIIILNEKKYLDIKENLKS